MRSSRPTAATEGGRWVSQWMRGRSQSKKRVLALAMITGLLVVGGAVASFATHTVCDDSDGDPNDDIQNTTVVPGVGTVWVGVDHAGGSGVLGGVGGWRGVCVRHTSSGGTTTYRSAFVGVSDPNPASTGATTTVLTCTGAPCSGTTTVLGDTGAEAGSVSGTMVTGTTAYANGTPANVDPTGLDKPRPTAVQTGPAIPVCVGTCVNVPGPPYKVDSGYDVVVEGSRIKLCASVGTTC